MSDGLVQILDGNMFVVSDRRGDIEASRTDPTGLFSFDTRLSRGGCMTIDGQRLNPLSVDDLQYFETRFFLVPGTGTVYVDAKLSLIRRRAVGVGFHEQLTIFNHDREPVDVTVRIEAASDFADLFEVKDSLEKKGTYSTRIEDGKLVLSYERETFMRVGGDLRDRSRRPRGDRTPPSPCISSPTVSGRPTSMSPPDCSGPGRRTSRPPRRGLAGERACNATSSAGSPTRRASSAIGSRSRPPTGVHSSISPPFASRRPITPGKSLPAAGLPWFMTMFGRDSIFTSLQALPFTPELAATTIRALALWQGRVSTTSATRTPVASCTRCATGR